MICILLWKTKELKSFVKQNQKKKKICRKEKKEKFDSLERNDGTENTDEKKCDDDYKIERNKEEKFADIYYSDINAILISTEL